MQSARIPLNLSTSAPQVKESAKALMIHAKAHSQKIDAKSILLMDRTGKV